MQTWLDHHPGWEYRLWTDENLPVLTNNRLFESLGSLWHGKADVARYEILHRFGGVYIDADSECVRPLDERLLACEAFACFENESLRPGVIANGFMGAVPGSRLTRALIEAMSRESLGANLPPWRVTGPTLLTAVASSLEATALTIYPSYLFLPTHYTGEQYRGDGPVYAIHHWSTTEREARARTRVKSLPRRALRRAFEAWTKIAGGE
jgi:mannosyltransferase OCH1-like enzyme